MPGSVHVCLDHLSKAGKPQMFLVSSPQVSVVNNSHGRERKVSISGPAQVPGAVPSSLGTLACNVFLTTTPRGRYDHYPILHTRKPGSQKLRNFSETTQLIKMAEPGFKSTYEFLMLSCARTTLHPYIHSFIHSVTIYGMHMLLLVVLVIYSFLAFNKCLLRAHCVLGLCCRDETGVGTCGWPRGREGFSSCDGGTPRAQVHPQS